MSRFRSYAFLAPLLAISVPASSQGTLQSQMRGHSVVVQYTEKIFRHTHVAVLVWTEAIYVSSGGRIFAHSSVDGHTPRGPRHEHIDITPGSDNSGGSTPFEWTKTGLTRKWNDHRGGSIRQTIEIIPSNGELICRMSIVHSRFISGSTHQICKVVKGNPLGGI